MTGHQGELRFDGQVAIVTGAGRGLGRAHARLLAQRGAAVIVNDIGGSVDGAQGRSGEDPAATVVGEIVSDGGVALADHSDVSDPVQAQALVRAAVDAYGRVDIVVANAGILRRRPFGETTIADLDALIAVHQRGTYSVCRAAWPHMAAQKYGRIITTISSALFGIDNSATYASAKGGVLGLSKVMAMEGADVGIRVNMLAPVASTRMTASGPAGARFAGNEMLSPDRVAVLVALLAHESCPMTGEMFMASGARVSRLFLGQTPGVALGEDPTPETLLASWPAVVSTDGFTVPQPRREGVITAAAAGEAKPGN
ncbi:SDR family NAD(P)-dependent oxidoreductase [Streptomyces sp. NPDC001982]|uniref:SDR family NAD(P)-dependent oxidoreductase n=1 Tax=unclassified Streptomyces TaxID=2593676 RepID=UPI00332C93AC